MIGQICQRFHIEDGETIVLNVQQFEHEQWSPSPIRDRWALLVGVNRYREGGTANRRKAVKLLE